MIKLKKVSCERIYINEDLTKQCYDLARLARQMVIDGKIKSTYIGGKIWVLKNENEKPKRVTTVEGPNSV